MIGERFVNTSGKEYQVINCIKIKKDYFKYTIKFTESGYERPVSASDIKKGLIRDRLSKTIYNVGCLGYGDTIKYKKEYNIWINILKRCYCKKDKDYHNYGGAGVTVCDRWLRFDHFIEDLPLIRGYMEEDFFAGLLELDKDKRQQQIPDIELSG